MQWKRHGPSLVAAVLLAIAANAATITPAFADCTDEVEEVDKEIRDNRDKYTAEAIAEARKQLGQARLHIRDRSVNCRREVTEARRALRQGKKD